MATGYKIDLMPTTFRRGVNSNIHDHAERYAVVYGVGNNPLHSALDEAINFIIAQAGQVHHMDSTLKLQTVTARKDKLDVLLRLEYFRRSVDISTHSFEGARFRGATYSTVWWRTPIVDSSIGQNEPFDGLGRPQGILNFARGGNKLLEKPPPEPWMWERPAVSIHVPFVLNSNPIAAVAGRLGTVNNSSVSMGGNSFAANTLLFESVSIDQNILQLGVLGLPGGPITVEYRGTYDFLTVKGGFVYQTARWDTDATPHIWTTEINGSNFVPEKPSSNFLSPPFPV